MRSRTRNVIAVSVLWAGLTAVAAAEPVIADSRSSAVAIDDGTAFRAAKAAKGIGLVTAAAAPVHGVADDGSEFNGTFQLRRLREKQGVLYAVGNLSGVLGTQLVNQRVLLPVTGASNPVPEEAQGFRQPVPTPGACDILTLALGPLDLDLLGLRVALDEVNLLIEAIPGAGNLLGNLLCGVAGLLDGGLGSGLGGLLQGLLDAIADLLNGLLGV
jgi:hypothetical protein